MNARELIQALVEVCRADSDAEGKTVMIAVTSNEGTIALVKRSHALQEDDPAHCETALTILTGYYYTTFIQQTENAKEMCLGDQHEEGEPSIDEALRPDDEPKTRH